MKQNVHVTCDTCTGNNLTGVACVAVQFATQDQRNATQVQKCIAAFTIKYPITIYIYQMTMSMSKY